MLMNNLQNFTTLDYFSLGLGFSLLSYSIYYFSGYLSNTYVNNNINSLPNTETFTQRLVENLESHSVANLDNKVPTMSNFVDTIEQSTNTDGAQLVDSSVQTDPNMLYDYLRELLYNNATPTTSLGEISPTDFINEYRNNPEYASYFKNTAKWSESIGDPSLFKSNSSEYNFLTKLREVLGVDSSPSSLTNSVPQIREPIIPQTEIEGIRLAKFDEIINCNHFIRNENTEALLNIIINSQDYSYLLLPSNNSEIIASVMMLIS